MVEIQVRTAGGEYTVYVGHELYEEHLGEELRRLESARALLVSHPAVFEMHGERLRMPVEVSLKEPEMPYMFLFEQGEEHKNLATVEMGYRALLKGGMGREDVVLAFGGGVVGDLAGFLAATYMRGIRLLQLPTTLMALVDSSIGGKVGVDLPGAKNAVGSFYQPSAVLCDIDVLGTLPERELRSGLAEVAKYGFLYDEALLRVMEGWNNGMPDDVSGLDEIIATCVAHKARVVSMDERDTSGVRVMLNYGHTFGHALESSSGYVGFRHGEAVAAGMMMAARLSELIGLAERGLFERHRSVLDPLMGDELHTCDVSADKVMSDMKTDKKKGRDLRFVLLERPQAPCLVESVQEDLVKRAVVETLSELRRA
jgi:3-dehydroquinate synthase